MANQNATGLTDKLFSVSQFKKSLEIALYGKDYVAGTSMSKKNSQKDLADKIEAVGGRFSKSQISNYMNAKSEPTAEGLVCISKALGVSVDYLLGLSDSVSNDETDKLMNKKYALSDTAMANLAKWKKADSKVRTFSEHKVLVQIMEDGDFLSDLVEYFFAHQNLYSPHQIPDDERELKKEVRNIVSGLTQSFNEFAARAYNAIVEEEHSSSKSVFPKSPPVKWCKYI